jgi:ATP-dependent DNA helicase PIF1
MLPERFNTFASLSQISSSPRCDVPIRPDDLWPEGVNPTPDFIAALDYVRHSQGNLFVTGRAGTGKSTLLRALVKSLEGEVVIGAPTGIAALNVGGETIHSLFRLPRGLLLDGDENEASPRNIFELDDITLVIDEVSMVRADVLNAIDVSLREQRESDAPFGGVRVIAFGDTHQLPPVLTGGDEGRLRQAFGGALQTQHGSRHRQGGHVFRTR